MVRTSACLLVVALSAGAVSPAASQSWNTQSGARGTAQAGALTARAPDVAAVTYNPAALVHLGSAEFQVGLQLDRPRERYVRGARTDRVDHPLLAPPEVYFATRHERFAIGIGIDSAIRHRQRRPAAGLVRDFQARGYEVHPAVAFAIDERWSVGAGARYLRGRLEDVYESLLDSGRNPNTFFIFAERAGTATADAWTIDAAASYRASTWGFGAVYSWGAVWDGTADVTLTPIPPGRPLTPRAERSLTYLLQQASRDLGIDIPAELRAGVWTAPHPVLKVEVDVDFTQWSRAGWRRPRELGICGSACSTLLPRQWRNTLSLRVGAERALGERASLLAGFAYEPSPETDPPVPFAPAQAPLVSSTWTYALGAIVNLAGVSFDFGYSFRTRQEEQDDLGGFYSSTRHLVAVSTRMRF